MPTEAQWRAAEEAVGTRFPDHYKALLKAYGTGVVDDFVWLLSPATTNANLNLVTQAERQAATLRTIKEQRPQEVPFPLFPEPGALLPWAVTDNGDVLFWLTQGPKEQWPTVVAEARGPRWERIKGSTSEILAALLLGELRCALFPNDFPSQKPRFRPA
jgi:hypothetical protein